jgi:flagella basal body P-ring formation protein FlgA
MNAFDKLCVRPRPWQMLLGLLAQVALTVAVLSHGLAQAQELVHEPAAAVARAQVWLNQTLAQTQASGLPLRMEVVVGELDRKLKLAPCQQVEPYLPPGTKLWGRVRLGLRCMQGDVKWNVFLPITVKAWGPAWVVRAGVTQGTLLSQADAMAAEVDWAEFNSPIVANTSDWVGQTAAKSLSTGQAIRQDMLRATQVFQAGEQIRVLAQGAGFEILTSGLAVSSGFIGQAARVRMDNGRVLTGEVVDGRTVRLAL